MGAALERTEVPGHIAEDLSALQVARVDLRVIESAGMTEPAERGSRFIAGLIDLMVIGAAAKILSALIVASVHVAEKHPTLQLILSAVGPLYFSTFEYGSGQTLGKRVMKIKVLPLSGGELLGFWQVLGREFIGRAISIIAFGLGYASILYREDRRSFHDRVFRTQVVKVR